MWVPSGLVAPPPTGASGDPLGPGPELPQGGGPSRLELGCVSQQPEGAAREDSYSLRNSQECTSLDLGIRVGSLVGSLRCGQGEDGKGAAKGTPGAEPRQEGPRGRSFGRESSGCRKSAQNRGLCRVADGASHRVGPVTGSQDLAVGPRARTTVDRIPATVSGRGVCPLVGHHGCSIKKGLEKESRKQMSQAQGGGPEGREEWVHGVGDAGCRIHSAGVQEGWVQGPM